MWAADALFLCGSWASCFIWYPTVKLAAIETISLDVGLTHEHTLKNLAHVFLHQKVDASSKLWDVIGWLCFRLAYDGIVCIINFIVSHVCCKSVSQQTWLITNIRFYVIAPLSVLAALKTRFLSRCRGIVLVTSSSTKMARPHPRESTSVWILSKPNFGSDRGHVNDVTGSLA